MRLEPGTRTDPYPKGFIGSSWLQPSSHQLLPRLSVSVEPYVQIEYINLNQKRTKQVLPGIYPTITATINAA